MTFKRPKQTIPLTEEEQDAMDEYAIDVELYRKHELPLFVKEMALWGRDFMTPEKYLMALDMIFWTGLKVKHRGIPDIPVARYSAEVAMVLDEAIENKRASKEAVANILADAYLETYSK